MSLLTVIKWEENLYYNYIYTAGINLNHSRQNKRYDVEDKRYVNLCASANSHTFCGDVQLNMSLQFFFHVFRNLKTICVLFAHLFFPHDIIMANSNFSFFGNFEHAPLICSQRT